MQKSGIFLSASAVMAIAWSIPVLAKGAAPGDAPPASEAANPADIIVTARRVEERLQDVPISITAFDNRLISNRNIDTPNDLALYTPSLSTSTTLGSNDTSYAIRGFSQSPRTAASVAVYFADVVAPRGGPSVTAGDGAGPGQFMDLQNVQVLKGPQGTLFGRNTTGGAVLLVPYKPADRFEGYLEGQYGDYDWKVVRGAINVPLSDIARLRIAGEFQDRNGVTKNYGIGPSAFDDRHFYSLRASLVVDLTPNLENYTIVSYSKSHVNGTLNQLLGCNGAFYPVGVLACGTPATDQLARQQGRGPWSGENDIANPYNQTEQWGIINTTTWHASDSLTIKNIVSYTELNSDIQNDVGGTNFTIPNYLSTPVGPNGALVPLPTGALAGLPISFIQALGGTKSAHSSADQYTATEELQFQGHAGRLTWQAGLYGELSGPLGPALARSTSLISCTDPAAFQCVDSLRGVILSVTPPGFQAFVPPVGSTQSQATTINYRNLGIYGQATYALTDKLNLTGGIRYTNDKTRSTGTSVDYYYYQDNVPTPNCTNAGAVLPFCSVSLQQKSAKPTWLVSVDYKPSSDVLLYGKYSRGYRQGSVAISSADGHQTFEPESVDAYEAGAKLTLSGAVRGYFNVAGFYNKLSDQQLQATFQPIVGRTEAGIVNAGKSRVYGVEVDSAIVPFQGFTINANYAYLNTRLQSIAPLVFDPAKYSAGAATSSPGGDLPQSPHHKFSIGGSYQLPLDASIGQITAGAVFTYQASQLFPDQAGPFQKQPGYGLLNLNLNWDNVAAYPVNISVFATNVLNKSYRNFIFGLYETTGLEITHYGEPRIVGVKLRYKFGE